MSQRYQTHKVTFNDSFLFKLVDRWALAKLTRDLVGFELSLKLMLGSLEKWCHILLVAYSTNHS